MRIEKIIAVAGVAIMAGCSPAKDAPVELFPEDMCSSCRMSVSDPAYASEIITSRGEVLKFDDLRCLENYRKAHPEIAGDRIYLKDVDTKEWMGFDKGILVRTSMNTPMGSGIVAVRSRERAAAIAAEFPPSTASDDMGNSCCAPRKD